MSRSSSRRRSSRWRCRGPRSGRRSCTRRGACRRCRRRAILPCDMPGRSSGPCAARRGARARRCARLRRRRTRRAALPLAVIDRQRANRRRGRAPPSRRARGPRLRAERSAAFEVRVIIRRPTAGQCRHRTTPGGEHGTVYLLTASAQRCARTPRVVLERHRVASSNSGRMNSSIVRVARRLHEELAPLRAPRISPSSITISPPLIT